MDFPAGHPFILFNLESKKKKVYTVMEQVTNLFIQETASLFCWKTSWIKEQLV